MKTLAISLIGLSMAATSMCQEMPSRPKELDVFTGMLGKWSGDVKWTMTGMEGSMKMTMDNSWDGMFMKSVSNMDFEGMKMSETAFMHYDSAKKALMATTFTSWAPTPRIEKITVSGNKHVYLCDGWDSGMGMMKSRSTLTVLDPSKIEFKLEFETAGKWENAAIGTLTKVK